MTDLERPDGILPPSASGGVDITTASNATIAGDVSGRDKISNFIQNIFQVTPTVAETRRDQLILLNKVRTFWVKGVLEKSIHGAALIELSKETQASVVERPWEMVIETPDQPDWPIPPGTPIIQVFDEMERALLILGAPGSGKTITLLELARDLLDRAEVDPAQPIPVVFNLSPWAEHRPPLIAWMVDELSSKYQIPRKIGSAWLEAHDLLPMLDGLDEVRVEHRNACVEAINTYRQEHGLAGLAVCSRDEDYEALTRKLKLSSAIVIQQLTERQIDDWLIASGEKLSGLRATLQTDPVLQALARSPLMLSVMSLACEGMATETFASSGSIEAHRKHIFDAYVQRMLKRRSADKGYTSEQTVKWLAWLAKELLQRRQSVFLIESLSLSWLRAGIGQILYRASNGLVIMLWVLLAAWPALLGALALPEGTTLISKLIRGPQYIVLSAFVCVSIIMLYGFWDTGVRIVEALRWSWPEAIGLHRNMLRTLFTLVSDKSTPAAGLIPYLLVGFLVTLLFAWVLSRSLSLSSTRQLALMLFTLPVGTLLFGALGGLMGGLNGVQVETRTRPNQGVVRSAKNALICGGLFGLFGIAAGALIGLYGVWVANNLGLRWHIPGGLSASVYIGIVGGWAGLMIGFFFYGLLGVVRHFTLRLLLFLDKSLPWNLTHFLDHCAERILLQKVGGGYIFIHRLVQEYFAG
ncbi:MAG: NACHT domain-containing protein, partial [Anaerolineales bacterium]